MTRDRQSIAAWIPGDAPGSDDWIDRIEYAVSEILGYALLASAAVFGVYAVSVIR